MNSQVVVRVQLIYQEAKVCSHLVEDEILTTQKEVAVVVEDVS